MPASYLENPEKLLDDTGWAILRVLQADARLSYAEIGRQVGLSAPAVMERVKRLEEAGIITGYRTEINLARIGLPLVALIRCANMGKDDVIAEAAKQIPGVLECHHVLGNDCYYLKVAVPSIQHLERVLGILAHYTQTTTSIVMSSPIAHRAIEPEILDELHDVNPIAPNGRHYRELNR